MKPLEFKIEKNEDDYRFVFYFENGEVCYVKTTAITYWLELNKHYSIADIYGYKVVDDREGL